MPIPFASWFRRNRPRRNDPFTRATHGDLDITMVPPYDMSEAIRDADRREVEALLAKLGPRGLDAGSREVLSNWINDRADQMLARLTAERDERQAVGDVLVGLAREEVARRKSAYDRDVIRVRRAHEAAKFTHNLLTGQELSGPFPELPGEADERPITTTLGKVDISRPWVDPATGCAEATEPADPDEPTQPGSEIARYDLGDLPDLGLRHNGVDPTKPIRSEEQE